MKIDWNNPKSPISNFFTVHEATFLPSWNVYHIPSDAEKDNITSFAQQLDKIRILIGIPFIIHVWIRPLSTNCPNTPQYHRQNYNAFVGSTASKSAHITGNAVDFHVKGHPSPSDCNCMRNIILPHLNEYNLRMENLPNSSWIHLDNAPVITNRFFKP